MYSSGCRRLRIDQLWRERGEICSVTEIARAAWRTAAPDTTPCAPITPWSIREQLAQWGHGWIWKDLNISGDGLWLNEAIKQGTCTVVADGSFMREVHPQLFYTAFILECSKGMGVFLGSFAELSAVASAFQGELLGLMVVHLILQALQEVVGTLTGNIKVYSDCKGALSKVWWLPASRIPARCRHSDILKVILQAQEKVVRVCMYKHVRVHQDDSVGFYIFG